MYILILPFALLKNNEELEKSIMVVKNTNFK